MGGHLLWRVLGYRPLSDGQRHGLCDGFKRPTKGTVAILLRTSPKKHSACPSGLAPAATVALRQTATARAQIWSINGHYQDQR
jgi:hypothetical protein